MEHYRLVRVGVEFSKLIAIRDNDGCRLTFDWGEPHEDGTYTPTITRHPRSSMSSRPAATLMRT